MERIGLRDVLEEDEDFQRKEYTFEKIGWWIILAILIAALLGFVGNGPFSSREIKGEHYTLKYDRFEHNKNDAELDFKIDGNSNSPIRITIDNDYFFTMQLRSVTPQPSMVAEADHTVFLFPSTPGQGSYQIRFVLDVHQAGKIHGHIQVNDETPVEVNQFIYP